MMETEPKVLETATDINTVTSQGFEILITASIETLSQSHKKCGKEEIYNLAKNSLDHGITKVTVTAQKMKFLH